MQPPPLRFKSLAKAAGITCLACGTVLAGLAFAAERNDIAPGAAPAVPAAFTSADPLGLGSFVLPLLRPVAWRRLVRAIN